MRTPVRIKRRIHLGVIWGATAVVLSCTADKMTAPNKPSLDIAPGGGEGQTGVVGSTLPQPIAVQVTGVWPVNGQIVNFVVTSGGGSVFANVLMTWRPSTGPWAGLDGIGQNNWTLGPTAGPVSYTHLTLPTICSV